MTGFANRHIGTDASAQSLMLSALGYDSLPALMDAAVPGHLRMAEIVRSAIPAAASEAEALAELRALADANTVRRSLMARATTAPTPPRSLSAMCWKTPAGTPPTPPTSQRFSRPARSASQFPNDGC